MLMQKPRPLRCKTGFTLIELLVVLSIIGLLLTLAIPRYFVHVEHTKEAALKETLAVVRDSLDKYYSDNGKYPNSLDELVEKRYIRKPPYDPVADSASQWILIPPPPPALGSVYDLRSGASGEGTDGTPYREW